MEILVGAGVTAQNIPALAAQTGAHAFHLSGKQVLQSRMTFRREGVPMGLPGFSEFEVWQTGEETSVLHGRHWMRSRTTKTKALSQRKPSGRALFYDDEFEG